MEEFEGYFNKKSAYYSFFLLRSLALSEKPLGSWILKERMSAYKINLSLATIGRLLKDLDQMQFTDLIPSQGRTITSLGKHYLAEKEREIERFEIESKVMKASNPENYEEIVNLLYARKVIEVETIKLVVIHARDEDIKRLQDSVDNHVAGIQRQKDYAINFHEIIAELSCNRFLCSALKLLIHEEVIMEEKFPKMAKKLRDVHHIHDHQLILEAVKDRDVDLAMRYMEEHMEKLVKSIQ